MSTVIVESTPVVKVKRKPQPATKTIDEKILIINEFFGSLPIDEQVRILNDLKIGVNAKIIALREDAEKLKSLADDLDTELK